MDEKDEQIEQKAVEDSLKDGARKAEKAAKKVTETVIDIGRIVADVLAGNYVGAILRGLKYLGKILLIILIIVVLLAGSVYVIWNSVGVEMDNIMDTILEFKNNFIEKMFDILDVNDTNKWINIDEKLEVQNSETGNMEEMTLVDYYIQRMESLGVSVAALKLLGDADYTSEAVMNEPDNKEKIQKYIKEFIRADIITQEIHRRDPLWGDENAVVNKNNENKIDGGVFLYRTTREDEDNLVLNKNKNKFRMIFKTYEEFLEYPTGNQEAPEKLSNGIIIEKVSNSKINEIESIFTIDPTTDDILYYSIDTEEYKKKEYKVGVVEEYKSMTVTLQRHAYKNDIAKYALPYEFLVNLCNVTQNPEFVYHVAYMARNTRIELLIQDSYVQTNSISSTSGNIIQTVTNYSVSPGGAVSQEGQEIINNLGSENDIIWSEKIITTATSELVITKVDSWSYALETAYENVNEVRVDNEVVDKFFTKTVVLSYSEPYINEIYGLDGKVTSFKSNYYRGENCWTTVTEKTTENKFYPTIVVAETTKFKQFLGLLTNSTGKCSEDDCYKNSKKVEKCIENAVFRKGKEGIDVSYRLPNSTNATSPRDKLFGAQELFLSLLAINEDRFQGLIEYMKYIFSEPDNEEIQFLDDDGTNLPDNNDNDKYEDITDEELELLYKVCEAEAGGSSEAEIGHVASVVLNRVNASKWPNTISGVVYQSSQFSCVTNPGFSSIVPSEKTKRAVDNVLANGDTTGGAYYYRTEESAIKAGMPTSPTETHNTYIYLFKDPNTHIFYTDKDLGATTYPIKKDSYIVTIDAGHGPKPNGAKTVNGYWNINGVKYYTSGTQGTYEGTTYVEWECARAVADKVASILASNPKITPVIIGKGTTGYSILKNSERIPAAKNADSDLHVTIHFNSSAESSANGTECLSSPGDTVSYDFAKTMSETISQALGTKNRGANSNSSWTIIQPYSKTGFPNIIAEGLFMSNQGDMEILANGGINKYAEGIANGIVEYLGL